MARTGLAASLRRRGSGRRRTGGDPAPSGAISSSRRERSSEPCADVRIGNRFLSRLGDAHDGGGPCVRNRARFAGGYLDCAASTAGRALTHACVEFYLTDLGWRGFDSTIGEPVSLKHATVGVSHHPRGVTPVTGPLSRRFRRLPRVDGQRQNRDGCDAALEANPRASGSD